MVAGAVAGAATGVGGQVASRLTQRSDDTEDAVRTRLRVHHENVDVVRNAYLEVLQEVSKTMDHTQHNTFEHTSVFVYESNPALSCAPNKD